MEENKMRQNRNGGPGLLLPFSLSLSHFLLVCFLFSSDFPSIILLFWFCSHVFWSFFQSFSLTNFLLFLFPLSLVSFALVCFSSLPLAQKVPKINRIAPISPPLRHAPVSSTLTPPGTNSPPPQLQPMRRGLWGIGQACSGEAGRTCKLDWGPFHSTSLFTRHTTRIPIYSICIFTCCCLFLNCFSRWCTWNRVLNIRIYVYLFILTCLLIKCYIFFICWRLYAIEAFMMEFRWKIVESVKEKTKDHFRIVLTMWRIWWCV